MSRKNREHLPYSGPSPEFTPELDARDQGPIPARETLGAPDDAPNVLLVLVDDMGFGASSAFGGPCSMPATEQLAEGGLRYSRFHTTAICSPTRAALLTGRNHHSVGMGSVVEASTGTPGNDGKRPKSAGTLAQTLSYNGYATAAFGKWHQTPTEEKTAAGSFEHWPTQEGFDRFYGFVGAEDNQFTPHLTDGTTFIDPPATEEEGYHLSEDLVDKAKAWIKEVRTFNADKPWFTYLAFGATHAPFHVPESWRDRNRGDFAHGWDRQREITLAKQKELGVVPEDAELAPWVPGLPHWDEIGDTEKLAAERLMELYAAFAEHTDLQVGRLIKFLREEGELDNTIVVYILGDNGASAEGGLVGTLNEGLKINGFEESAERIVEHLDELGGPNTYAHYPASWAVAMNTPYQWTKQVASHYGGTRNGTIVHWPKGIEARGEIRNQWHHVIDVAPTILEAAGLPHPETIDGVEQQPIEGTSFLYSLNDPEAAERHTTQYFEMHGNRGIYHEGWTAVTKHRIPWNLGKQDTLALADDVWELYDTNTDWSQARDLADEHPEKLAELQELFLVEAKKYNVLPIDDRMVERVLSRLNGETGLTSITLTPELIRLPEEELPSLKNTSYAITVDFETSGNSADGVLVAQGGRFGGWSLYLKQGVPVFGYNVANRDLFHIRAETAVAAGRHVLEYRFAYDGGGFGKGGDGLLLLDGEQIGQGRLEATVPFIYSINETLNVGIDRGTPVTGDYSRGGGNPFDGQVHTVTITTDADAIQPSVEQQLEATLVAH